jgi:hypothetical protein
MGIVDKLLLVLLLLLLPVGIFVASTLSKQTEGKSADGSSLTDAATVEDLKKMLESMQNQPKSAPKDALNPIEVTSVAYASDSGRLQVAGLAPQAQVAITVSATVLPPESLLPQEINASASADSNVLGHAVDVKSIKPASGGSFVYEYALPRNEGLVQVTLQQGQVTKVVQFDIKANKQIL